MHLSDGELRSYYEQELVGPEGDRARSHLLVCERCRDRAEAVASRARTVGGALASLAPNQKENPPSKEIARARFEARRIDKEKATMFQKIFSRQYRPALIALVVIALLGASLTFPPVRAIANSFLGLFRVQTVTFVQFDPGEMQNALESSDQFQQLISDDVKVEELGKPEEVASAEEASSLAGIPVRFPTEIDGQPRLILHPGTRFSFEVDLPRLQALMAEIGQGDIELPAEIDGTTVTMELPSMVAASYGNCESRKETGEDPDEPYQDRRDCTILIQMASPEISAPPGLDLARIGQAYLQLLGMTPEEAKQFSQTVDWTTTLIVPIPRYEAMSEDVTVDGVKGSLIWQWTDSASIRYVLIWVKDDIVYSLTGMATRARALQIANSLK
jgi:hypothetical protein